VSDRRPAAAVYLRVSKADQSVEHQRAECLAACVARGWRPIVIEEQGSGVKIRRGWQQVKAMAEEGAIVGVVVWAIDRMGRSLWSTVDAVRDFDKQGVRVVSVKEPWVDVDPSSMVRGLLLPIFDWIAAQERERLLERLRAAQATARKRGKHAGRPRRLSGELLELAVRLHLDGKSYTEIGEALAAKGLKISRAVLFERINVAIDFDDQTPESPRRSREITSELARLRREQKADADAAAKAPAAELAEITRQMRDRAEHMNTLRAELEALRVANVTTRKAS
jgi:DNA invertase Pin-like site-specific DNA recombinase